MCYTLLLTPVVFLEPYFWALFFPFSTDLNKPCLKPLEHRAAGRHSHPLPGETLEHRTYTPHGSCWVCGTGTWTKEHSLAAGLAHYPVGGLLSWGTMVTVPSLGMSVSCLLGKCPDSSPSVTIQPYKTRTPAHKVWNFVLFSCHRLCTR